mmetsp:Transcript_10062/g.15377  ORF Transcript_10062/g.15377 Transcript_10062/m.15377 type:complete len:216 (-) Transcript_10062:1757-2404(-)
MNQNFMIELTDENSDLTILPLQLSTNFRAKIRPGHKMPLGQTEEVKFEMDHFKVHLFDPQDISKEHQLHEFGRPYESIISEEAKEEEDDDDDFDEDDEEEEGDKAQGGGKKVCNLALLVRSFLPVVKEQYMHLLEEWLDTRFEFEPGSFMTGLQGSRNEYYPFVHKYGHDFEYCMGMEAREPQIWMDGDRLLWSATFNKDMVPSIDYCNSELFVK